MKNPKLTPMLLGITAVSAVLSILLVAMINQRARQMRKLQEQVIGVNQALPAINLMVQELNAFSEKNPSIDPILISAGVKQTRDQGAKTTPK